MKYAEAWAELKRTLEMFESINHSIRVQDTLLIIEELEEKYE